MFCKLDVRSKSIVTLTLSWYNRKIVVRYFANRAPASHAMQAASIIALELQHSSKTQTSAETQDDFQHCWSLEQHADSTKWFTRYDFLLVFYSDLQSLNNCTCCLYMLKNTHPKTQKILHRIKTWKLHTRGRWVNSSDKWLQVCCHSETPAPLFAYCWTTTQIPSNSI